jgi:hypothetical protein
MSLSQHVNTIRELAPKLNEAVDTANRTIKTVEAFLHEHGVGVAASVVFESESVASEGDDTQAGSPPIRRERRLSYGRLAGSFRIHVSIAERRAGEESGAESSDLERVVSETPWDSCSREVKLAAVAVLPALIERLAASLTHAVSGATESANVAASLMNVLTGEPTESDPFMFAVDLRTEFESAVEHFFEWQRFEEYPQIAYVDRERNRLVYMFESDDDAADLCGGPEDAARNAAARERIESDPDRFIEVEELDDDALPEFIESDWTDDAALKRETAECYHRNRRRYRAFKDNAPPEAVEAFYAYQDRQRKEDVRAWLAEQGIELD